MSRVTGTAVTGWKATPFTAGWAMPNRTIGPISCSLRRSVSRPSRLHRRCSPAGGDGGSLEDMNADGEWELRARQPVVMEFGSFT